MAASSSLENLLLLGGTYFHPLNAGRLSWNYITDINLSTITLKANTFTEIMRRTSPSLTRANFSVSFPRVAHRLLLPSLKLVYMPSLVDLHINLFNFSQDMRLLDFIHLPALECLQVHVRDEYSEICELSTFIKMIQSVRTLQTLIITHSSPRSKFPPYILPVRRTLLRPYIIQEFFEGLKNLRILALPCGMVLPFSLISNLAHGILLPRLTRCALTATHSNWEHVAAMVHTRDTQTQGHLSGPGCSSFPYHLPCRLVQAHILLPPSVYHNFFNWYQQRVGDVEPLRVVITFQLIPDDLPIYLA